MIAEKARLIDQVRDLRQDLDATQRENGDLRRELSRARVELQRLRARERSTEPASALAQLERAARIRLMLSDTHSRNP